MRLRTGGVKTIAQRVARHTALGFARQAVYGPSGQGQLPKKPAARPQVMPGISRTLKQYAPGEREFKELQCNSALARTSLHLVFALNSAPSCQLSLGEQQWYLRGLSLMRQVQQRSATPAAAAAPGPLSPFAMAPASILPPESPSATLGTTQPSLSPFALAQVGHACEPDCSVCNIRMRGSLHLHVSNDAQQMCDDPGNPLSLVALLS